MIIFCIKKLNIYFIVKSFHSGTYCFTNCIQTKMSTRQTNVVLFTITEPYKSTCPKCQANGYHTISCPTTIQCRECFAIGCHKVSCSKLEKCEGCGIIAGLGMHLKDCPKITHYLIGS